jgi:spermidine/putrescine transport system permease protein
MTYDFLPFMILPIYTTLSSIDKSYAEAAEDLGARPYQVLLRTTLPLSVPGIISGVMMVFLPTMSSFVISDYMSNNKITLFGSFINRTYNTVLQNVGSAYSIILLIAIGLTLLASSALNKLFSKGAPVNAGGGGRLW